jgi:hypothetical protein
MEELLEAVCFLVQLNKLPHKIGDKLYYYYTTELLDRCILWRYSDSKETIGEARCSKWRLNSQIRNARN